MGTGSDRQRDASPRCAADRRCRNARVASRGHLNRANSAPAGRADKDAELLDDLLITLRIDLPDAWSDLADALPNELLYRIDQHLQARLP